MSTYYVSSAGNDLHVGSIGSPFLTVGHAASVCADGDTIDLNGGNTFSENVAFATGVGVTVQSYGTGQATIAGANTSSTLSFDNPVSLVATLNIIVTNADNTDAGQGCVLTTISDGLGHGNGFTATGCTITGGSVGIWLNTTTLISGNIGPVTITNNTCSASIIRAIWTHQETTGNYNYYDVLISGNTVSSIPGITGTDTIGIEASGCYNGLINGNTVTNIGSSGGHSGTAGSAAIMAYYWSNVAMTGNVVSIVYAGTGEVVDGIGIDIDFGCVNCAIIKNYIYRCQGAGITMFSAATAGSKQIIAGNVVVNCGLLAADDDSSASRLFGADVDFYSNTILGKSPLPSIFVNPGTAANKRILNNALIAPAGVPTISLPTVITGLVMDGNYHQSGAGQFLASWNSVNYTTLAAWKTATGLEASGVAAGHCNFVQPQPPPVLTAATLAGATSTLPSLVPRC